MALVWLIRHRLIPLAAIVAPGTLSIKSEQFTTYRLHNVTYLDFTSLSFAAGLVPAEAYSNSMFYAWSGPRRTLERVALAIGAQLAMLPMTALSPNASWVFDFYGPSLSCQPIDKDRNHRNQANVAAYTAFGTQCHTANTHLAWFGDLPSVSSSGKSNLTHSSATLSSSILYTVLTRGRLRTLLLIQRRVRYLTTKWCKHWRIKLPWRHSPISSAAISHSTFKSRTAVS